MKTAATKVLSARAVTKVYGGTHALRGVDFDIAAGRVTALFGKDGAGTSTLLKILSGVEQPTTGHVELDGEPVRLLSPRDAADRGISVIPQKLSLCPNLSIQDNLFLTREICGGPWVIDRSAQRATSAAILRSLGEDLDPDRLVGALSPAQQQIVGIARALVQEARVLIMDEPTSTLTPSEVEALFRVIGGLTASGVAVAYASHQPDRALRIADDVAILRDGRLVAAANAKTLDIRRIVEQMAGRAPDSPFPHHIPLTEKEPPREELLTLRGLSVADPANPGRLAIDDLSLTVGKGEIVGIYGLMDSGLTELLEALAGRASSQSGDVLLSGIPLENASIRDRIDRGLVLVPGDRRRDGLVQTMSLGENLSLAGLDRFVRRLFVSRERELDAVDQMISDVTLGTGDAGTPVESLSGGDQQKAVIGRALLTDPLVLLLDEPSRGVDIGAKADIFQLLAARARRGLAVLFTTLDAEEALHIPDRLLVLTRGVVTGDFRRGAITREELMSVLDGAAIGHAEGGAR
ncbi:sugar ABC transporter ATP-binding protein [Streptosporangium amethystogenes]|uniref:sugar ABC transporter ATP-binding protein n=1 Tax=Streptosporangium amethystogenes TaxID=2002 RepID=UPI0004C73E36|nr:sugar ABC transporter ATP-binding protein [Streptosporangium amethystogenes]